MGFQGVQGLANDSLVSRVCEDWHMIHGFPGIKEERVR